MTLAEYARERIDNARRLAKQVHSKPARKAYEQSEQEHKRMERIEQTINRAHG